MKIKKTLNVVERYLRKMFLYENSWLKIYIGAPFEPLRACAESEPYLLTLV